MRVAIDVTSLSRGLRSGTAVYVYRLVEALGALPGPLELRALYAGTPGAGAALARTLEGPRVKVFAAPTRWGTFPVRRSYPAPLAAEVRASDVFHAGEFVYPEPRSGQAVVATVHDVTTVLFPQWHFWANRLLHRRRLAWVRRHATRVIIVSEATRADTASVLAIPAHRLDVVPEARGTAALERVAGDQVRRRTGLGDAPYVLFVGTLEPRKNLVRLVEAFRRIPANLGPLSLVLVGSWGWRTRALRAALRGPQPSGRAVVVTGPVDGEVLAALYAGATVFAYPSRYEGFGLPLLEAMAARVPVLTSGGGACEEVAGKAALLVDPRRAESIGEGLERLLRSADERRRLAELGTRREREFSWARTAMGTLEVYRRALDESA